MDGMPETTQTTYMDSSVQATQSIRELHKYNVTPSLFGIPPTMAFSLTYYTLLIKCISKLCCEITGNSFVQVMKKDVGITLLV